MKILYFTKLTKKDIENKPSNFSYYVKNFYSYPEIQVELLNPIKNKYKNSFISFISIIKAIRLINPDIIYLDNLKGLNKFVVAKRLGLFKSKIVAWKYTLCKEYNNPIKKWLLKKIYWQGIDRIYMMYDTHEEHAISHNILKKEQVTTLSRGVEVSWYEKFIDTKTKDFVIIATGKDSRDYFTLCKACENTQTKCVILTRKHRKNMDVAKIFKNSLFIEIRFIEDLELKDEYSYIMHEVGKASVLAIPCEKKEYGVGYTNVIEGLPFRIPILLTYNPDIHLNPEDKGIGYVINPYDIKVWEDKINYLKLNSNIIEEIRKNINSLISSEYSDITTTNYIINDFTTLIQKGK